MIKIIVIALVCYQCGKNEGVIEMNVVNGAQASYNLDALQDYVCPECARSKWRLEIIVREKGGNGDGRVVADNT